MPPALPLLPLVEKYRERVEPRFWAKVDRRGPDECWLWTAKVNQWGYGLAHVGPRDCVASRVAWVLGNGTEPGEMLVCHTCDNTRCCNPAHLWLGTHGDNARDRAAKGRSRKRRAA